MRRSIAVIVAAAFVGMSSLAMADESGLGKMSGEVHGGRWVDVGTPERLRELDSQLRSLSREGTPAREAEAPACKAPSPMQGHGDI